MAVPTSPEIRAEVEAVLENDPSAIGDIWRRTQHGDSAEDIRVARGNQRPNFVWNYSRFAKALLEGDLPTAPSLALQAAQIFRRYLRENQFSPETTRFLEESLSELEAAAVVSDLDPDADFGSALEDILALQESWIKDNTPEMRRRGQLVPKIAPQLLKDLLPPESTLPFTPSIKGEDGQGNKARVPYIRVFSKEKSPRAGVGWYVVFLFAADGSAVYMTLGVGVTELTGGGEWELRPEEWIDGQVDWARRVLGDLGSDRLVTQIHLGDPRLGAHYDRGTAYALRYDRENLPDDEVIQADLELMLSALSRLYDAESTNPPGGGRGDFQLDRAWLEATTLWEPSQLDELLDVLSGNAPQVILAGPPGTSKSWVAQAVARYLTRDDRRRWRLVQFHPSYGYESFIEGLQPTVVDGAVSFELVPGTVLRMAEAAKINPDPHVLIMDEMNRANVPRVLGELMFLFEYRNQLVDLQYSQGFALPDNVLFIATMNTADRSIRSIDTALRRRFEVFECLPDVDVLKRFYGRGLAENYIADLDDGFIALNEQLGSELDRHHTIGQTFFMADLMTPMRLRRMWTRKIYPLIEEYFFDLPDIAQEFQLTRFWPSVAS